MHPLKSLAWGDMRCVQLGREFSFTCFIRGISRNLSTIFCRIADLSLPPSAHFFRIHCSYGCSRGGGAARLREVPLPEGANRRKIGLPTWGREELWGYFQKERTTLSHASAMSWCPR